MVYFLVNLFGTRSNFNFNQNTMQKILFDIMSILFTLWFELNKHI